MSDQLSILEQTNYQESMPSLSEALAKILASPENEKVLKGVEVPLLAKQLDSSMSADHVFLYGKMLKEHSAQTMARTFGQLSKRLPTLGVIDSNGNCLIRSGFYPKIASESTLSDILEMEVEDKYFLSQGTMNRLMGQLTQQIPVQSRQDTTQSEREVILMNCTKFHQPQNKDMKKQD